jgi:hypothetical protein
MSQENLELVRSISAAHERGDYGSANSLVGKRPPETGGQTGCP